MEARHASTTESDVVLHGLGAHLEHGKISGLEIIQSWLSSTSSSWRNVLPESSMAAPSADSASPSLVPYFSAVSMRVPFGNDVRMLARPFGVSS